MVTLVSSFIIGLGLQESNYEKLRVRLKLHSEELIPENQIKFSLTFRISTTHLKSLLKESCHILVTYNQHIAPRCYVPDVNSSECITYDYAALLVRKFSFHFGVFYHTHSLFWTINYYLFCINHQITPINYLIFVMLAPHTNITYLY